MNAHDILKEFSLKDRSVTDTITKINHLSKLLTGGADRPFYGQNLIDNVGEQAALGVHQVMSAFDYCNDAKRYTEYGKFFSDQTPEPSFYYEKISYSNNRDSRSPYM